jgi:hypothetical protein
MASIDFELLEERLRERERRVRRRTAILTIVPIIAATLVLGVVWNRVAAARDELAQITQELDRSRDQASQVETKLRNTQVALSEIIQITRQMEEFIEKKESFLRTIDEARFLISVRMLFDRINTQYRGLSKVFPDLPPLSERQWVAIMASSRDLQMLRTLSKDLASRLGQTDVAIYLAPNGFYALAIRGDGTFTTAYNNTVDAQNKGIPGAYFAQSSDWGRDYLR